MPNSLTFFEQFSLKFESFNYLFNYVFFDTYIPENKFYVFVHAFFGHLFNLNHSAYFHLLIEGGIHFLIILIFLKFLTFNKISISLFQQSILYFTFPSFFYSFLFLRDNLILLFVAVVFYLSIYGKYNIKNVIYILGCLLFLFFLRLETAIFSLSFLFVYFSRFRNPFILLVFLIPFMFIFYSSFSDYYESIREGYEVYNNYTNDKLNDGMGSMLYSLPSPYKNILIFFHGILQVPAWFYFTKSQNEILISSFSLLSNLFSSYIVLTLLSLKYFKNIFSHVLKGPIYLKLLLFIFLVYGFAQTINFTHRRALIFYFLFYFLSIKLNFFNFSKFSFMFLLFINLFYFILMLL
jgi:hypothetical protein